MSDSLHRPDRAVTTLAAEALTGEQVYIEHGWSGCDGSKWSRLSQATRDGWEFAARVLVAHPSQEGAVLDKSAPPHTSNP